MTRRLPTVALIALVGVVALSVSSSTLASPAGSPNNPKADIQSGNFFCGADVAALPVIGFTNYHRVGNVVSINYHLKGAISNSSYRVELWGNACTFFGVVTTITTNQNGVANGSGSMTIPAASTRFFATAFGPNGYNDTPAVTLLP